MKLRLRLAFTTVAVVVPVVLVLLWFDRASRETAGEQALASDALVHMRSGGRARCEAAPESWGGTVQMPRADAEGATLPEGPPLVLYGYDSALHARNLRAPIVEPALVAAARDGRDLPARRTLLGGRAIVEALVRMPWSDGPCAFVLARGPAAPRRAGVALPPMRIWIIPLAIGFAAVLLAVGPIVGRLRRLTDAVKRSARTGYALHVRVDGRDEIAELARAFDAASREIRAQLVEKERREQALREFIASTTHDMMIPLTVLQGHLASLKRRSASGQPVDGAVVVSAMDEAHYMASLMQNLAVVARLDATGPELHRGPVDLNAILTRVVARHVPIARQLQVSLDSAVPEKPVHVSGDVTLLEQAVSNLVYNAIRHNRPDGHVAAILERTAPDRFRLRVVDDGPGIPAAELSRLLERGYRGGAARSRAPDGQGLGLHITGRIADLHGLALALTPSVYGGLQVDITGPLIRA